MPVEFHQAPSLNCGFILNPNIRTTCIDLLQVEPLHRDEIADQRLGRGGNAEACGDLAIEPLVSRRPPRAVGAPSSGNCCSRGK